jgi:hypothetical protein
MGERASEVEQNKLAHNDDMEELSLAASAG